MNRSRPQRMLWIFAGALVGGALLGCEDSSESKVVRPSALRSELSDEPSPNASILPEPLSSEQGPRQKRGSTEPKLIQVERPEPEALPVGRELPLDDLPRGAVGSGYVLEGRFVLPLAESRLQAGEDSEFLWPQVTISLLEELPEQTARMSLNWRTHTSWLPRGTELRMRADRLGTVVIWPDGRSYRQAPVGSLFALLSDRRVDRLPPVESTLEELTVEQRGNRKWRRVEVSTSLGTAQLESVLLPELPYAAPLLCAFLAELMRVEARPELCAEGYLPLALSVEWKNGGHFKFEVTEYDSKLNLELGRFRIPPALPIYKRGELPPSEGLFLTLEQQAEKLAIKLERESFAPTPESPPAPDGAVLPPTETTLPPQPPDELELHNATDRPLILILDRLPVQFLGAGKTLSLRVRRESMRVAASDFFGQAQFDKGVVGIPQRVRFGEAAPASAP